MEAIQLRAALSRILNGNAEISAEMALRLSDALGTTPELWTGMQAQYELWQASKRRRKKLPRLTEHTFSSRPGKRGTSRLERVKKLIAGKRAKRKTRTFALYAIVFGRGDIFYPLKNGRS